VDKSRERQFVAQQIQGQINTDKSSRFRDYLPTQAEHIARKCLERMQNDLQSYQQLSGADIKGLAETAYLMLELRDRYGTDS